MARVLRSLNLSSSFDNNYCSRFLCPCVATNNADKIKIIKYWWHWFSNLCCLQGTTVGQERTRQQPGRTQSCLLSCGTCQLVTMVRTDRDFLCGVFCFNCHGLWHSRYFTSHIVYLWTPPFKLDDFGNQNIWDQLH